MATKEIVFITGANTGIGYEATKALLQSSKPYHVLLGSRDESKGAAAEQKLKEEVPNTASTVEVVKIDITDDDSIHKAIAYIKEKFGKLDVLINNAGASFDGVFTEDAPNFREIFNNNFNTNASSVQVITYAAAPLLIAAPSARLIFVTSGLSTLTNNSKSLLPPWHSKIGAGWPKEGLMLNAGYRTSKTALNIMMVMWHWMLKEDGVRTFCVSPGFLATGLGGVGAEKLRSLGARDPSLGGHLLKKVVEGERDEDAGKVVYHDGVVQDW